MDSNDETPPESLFPVASKFIEATRTFPSWVDLARIQRGEDLFWRHAYSIALVLLNKSLPEGYAAPNLSIILNISGNLRTHTFKRLLATLQLVLNVSSVGGFTPGGRAVISAQKLRLLHAAIRHLARKTRPDFEHTYGVPVNQEDLIATITGFSYLVILGLRTMGAGLTPDEENDFYYTWRVFAALMGIHPPGDPNSTAYLPDGIEDLGSFYAQYCHRHYVPAVQNPNGVALAAANMHMLRSMIPRPLRFLGFGCVPRLAMYDLMGPEACARIGIAPLPGHPIIKWLLLHLHPFVASKGSRNAGRHDRLARIIFQDMIKSAYGGEVTFTVPDSMGEWRDIVRESARAPGVAEHPVAK
jgi:hypothetical protein